MPGLKTARLCLMKLESHLDRDLPTPTSPSLTPQHTRRKFLELFAGGAFALAIPSCSSPTAVSTTMPTVSAPVPSNDKDNINVLSEFQEGQSIIGVPFVLRYQKDGAEHEVVMEFPERGFKVRVGDEIFEVEETTVDLPTGSTVLSKQKMEAYIDSNANVTAGDGVTIHSDSGDLHIPEVSLINIAQGLQEGEEEKITIDGVECTLTVKGVWGQILEGSGYGNSSTHSPPVTFRRSQ